MKIKNGTRVGALAMKGACRMEIALVSQGVRHCEGLGHDRARLQAALHL